MIFLLSPHTPPPFLPRPINPSQHQAPCLPLPGCPAIPPGYPVPLLPDHLPSSKVHAAVSHPSAGGFCPALPTVHVRPAVSAAFPLPKLLPPPRESPSAWAHSHT